MQKKKKSLIMFSYLLVHPQVNIDWNYNKSTGGCERCKGRHRTVVFFFISVCEHIKK